jgi:hypothetical protein
VMAVGDIHDINGYVFEETLHGPNVEKACTVCGERAYGTPDRDDHICQPCAVITFGAKPTIVRVLGERPRSRFLREGPGLAEADAKESRGL